MAASRKLTEADASVRARRWERGKFLGQEVYGKTLGIVGLGRIGSELSRMCRSLGLKVIAYDPYLPEGKAESLSVSRVPLKTLLKRSDYVSFHVPLTDETQGMVGERELSWMKKTGMVLNLARGGVVDESALAKALSEGRIAYAGLDVYTQEPPGDLAILRAPHIQFTPHVGAATVEAQQRVGTDLAQQILDYVRSGDISSAANLPHVDPTQRDRLHPTLLLAERLGRLASQLLGSPAEELRLSYSGQASVAPTAVTVWAVRGFLAPALGESVNYVNAMSIAAERRLKIVESRTGDEPDFKSRIEVEAIGRRGRMSVAGTVMAGGTPHLVSMDGFLLEAELSGHWIVLRNRDRPGVVGDVGTLLGKQGVNIAGLRLGRNRAGGRAISVIQVDKAPAADVLARLARLPNVLSVLHVAL